MPLTRCQQASIHVSYKVIHCNFIWIHFTMFHACIAPNTWLVACCAMVVNRNGLRGTFPLSDNIAYIWVVLCRLTSLVHLIPLRTMTTAAQLAPLFMSHIVRLHGLPDTIVSDRDPKFTSQFWTETHRLLGIKLARSTAFHPQTNGASERMIRKVSQVMRAMVKPDQLDWPQHLPMVEFAINSSVSASTGFAPFELMYGYIPWTIQTIGQSEFAGVQDFADNARDLVIRAHDALIESRVRQTHDANAR